MKHNTFPYVSYRELEEKVRRTHRWELFWALMLMVTTVALVAYWLPVLGAQMPWWSAGLFGFVLIWMGRSTDIPHGVRVEAADPDKLGPYTPAELHAIVQEVCESFYEKEIPNVYIVEDSSEAMAAVVNVDFLNFVRPWNAIYIGPYLLNALEPNELKAVLSHEMCHFSLHHTFWTRYFYLKILIFAAWMTMAITALFSQVGPMFSGQSWIIKLLLAYAVLHLGRFLLNIVTGVIIAWTSRPDSQEIEALCDYEATKRYGLLSMVNVLLKTGTRQEIYNTLLAQFSPSIERPLEELVEAASHDTTKEGKQRVQKQALAMQAAYLKLNEILPHHFLSLDEAQSYIEEAVRTGLDESKARRYRHRSRRVLRWLDHDHHVANHQLDRIEYETFIEELKDNPSQPLFYIPEEMDDELASSAEHPTFRNRILFLEYNHA